MNLCGNLEKLRRVISKYLWGFHWETETSSLNNSVSTQELKSAQKDPWIHNKWSKDF